VVISYRRFGTTYRCHLQDSELYLTDVQGQPIGVNFRTNYFLPTFRDNLSVSSSGLWNYFLPTFRDNLSVSSSGLGNYFLPTFRDNLSVPSSELRNYFLPTFRDNLSVPSSGLGIISYRNFGTTYRWRPQDSGIFLTTFRDNLGAVVRTREFFLTDVSK